MGGCGLDGVCDHINHFGYHIKGIKLWKALGAATCMLGPGENTEFSFVNCTCTELDQVEDEIFKNQCQKEQEFRRRQKQKKRTMVLYQIDN